MLSKSETIERIERSWDEERWSDIVRPYTARDVEALRSSIKIEYTLARNGAENLWNALHDDSYLATLGALSGNQAVQMVQAGIRAIYCSGWQVAADANLSGNTYPDQSLYPSDSVPALVRRINKALERADQVNRTEGNNKIDWFVPIVADGEAGFGGPLNVYELTKQMIEAGSAGVHFEDQLSSEKKCGHMGGKVLVPTNQFIRSLVSARLATDVLDVPTVIVARTDANGASLITSDIDPRDREFISGERTPDGFYRIRAGLDTAIARAKAYAPYADLLWCETATADIEEARLFAEGIHEEYPDKILAYNCSPSFNWEKNLNAEKIRTFQKELARMGYKYQFVTLAGWHTLNLATFELAREYASVGMPAYVKLQRREFAITEQGYGAVTHQRFVGTAYFDRISEIVSNGISSTTAMKGSTEEEQFIPERQ
ncbi:MAG: isocitrate lyase [Nitrososphaerota archaeon]|nr:isocitrate lyase [Nitrososphaerota archaeon]MDG6922109.1 isocitrate lyase [Nitrososphaerota archaeon]